MGQASDLPPLAPLLGALFPPNGLAGDSLAALYALQRAIDGGIAGRAVENDRVGRYPTQSIATLKRSGFLRAVLPVALGGAGLSRRASLEAQVRLAMADPAVAQIYKIHDEIVREILAIGSPELGARLARLIVEQDAIVGLAVAEPGLSVAALPTTRAEPRADGSFVVTGRKIYTTGAAEADLIATWAFNSQAAGVADTPLAGMQLLLIPPSAKGVTIQRDWDALGQRATDSGSIRFEAVETDPLWSVSRPGRFPPLHASLGYQAGFAAILTGIGIAALREAAAFVVASSRPWPSAEVELAVDDPYVRRLTGELAADLAGAYLLTLAAGDRLDAFECGATDRTGVAIPVYAAKSCAHRASLRATSEIHALMGTRSATRAAGFDRHWRNARMLSLHDPVDWKHAEIGRHVLTDWEPPPGLYQ